MDSTGSNSVIVHTNDTGNISSTSNISKSTLWLATWNDGFGGCRMTFYSDDWLVVARLDFQLQFIDRYPGERVPEVFDVVKLPPYSSPSVQAQASSPAN